MSSPSEHLVERLQQGSTEALAEVLEIYRARLLAYIERNLIGIRESTQVRIG